MKVIISLLVFINILYLQADEWQIKNIDFHTENDGDFGTDEAYTYGSSLCVLFYRDNIDESILHIPFTNYKNEDNYISFSYVQQIYTPEDIEKSYLIKDDRPYAGYTYLQTSLHQSYNNSLKSLSLQIGFIGPSTKMEDVQKFIHDLIGSPDPNGWEHQLQDEFTAQLNYSYKKYYKTEKFIDLESNFIPEVGFDLGNASTKLFTGVLYRFGWNIPKDYGTYPIDGSSYSKVPLKPNTKLSKDKWSFTFNISAKVNLIAQNIFLDGNTIIDSHSVDKNNLTLDAGYGISIAYERFCFDYLRKHTTYEYKGQDEMNSYGSFIFSYKY